MERVDIIGSGIIGLGVALKFAEEGFEVHVFSDEEHCIPTSPAAAAFWYPYACSMTDAEQELLALPTLRFLASYSAVPEASIQFRLGKEYFDRGVSDAERRPPWWAIHGVEFQELAAWDLPERVRSNTLLGPFTSGWSFRIPIVNMKRFLPWLRAHCVEQGVTFHTQRISTLTPPSGAALLTVNCTGGWSTHLEADPNLVGYKGVILEVEGEPFGSELIFIEKGVGEQLPTYIVPQVSRTLLGGTLEPVTTAGSRWPEQDSPVWTVSDHDVSAILCRVKSLVGEPDNLALRYERKCGLRPCRVGLPPRIEYDDYFSTHHVIHNYGHGGSGLTTFWGSAEAVFAIASQRILARHA